MESTNMCCDSTFLTTSWLTVSVLYMMVFMPNTTRISKDFCPCQLLGFPSTILSPDLNGTNQFCNLSPWDMMIDLQDTIHDIMPIYIVS